MNGNLLKIISLLVELLKLLRVAFDFFKEIYKDWKKHNMRKALSNAKKKLSTKNLKDQINKRLK